MEGESGCPGPFGLLEQITVDQVAYKQQKGIAHGLEPESPKVRKQVPAWSGEGPLPGHRLLVSSHARKGWASFWSLFDIRALVPFMRVLTHD